MQHGPQTNILPLIYTSSMYLRICISASVTVHIFHTHTQAYARTYKHIVGKLKQELNINQQQCWYPFVLDR